MLIVEMIFNTVLVILFTALMLYLSATGNCYKTDIILMIFCQNTVYLCFILLPFLVTEELIFCPITAPIYSGYLNHV